MFKRLTTFCETSARSKTRRQNIRRQSSYDFRLLEPRQLLAALIFFDSNSGIASIFGTAQNDSVTASMLTSTQLEIAVVGGATETYSLSDVTEIKFWGGMGDDYFANNTSVASFFGGDQGADTFLGGAGDDRVYAGDGDDVLYGGGGNDYLHGGGDNDVIFGDSGEDELHGGLGNDQIHGGDDDDYLAGEFGDDLIWGDGGVDFIIGSVGNDQLWGGTGDDRVYGQADDDIVYGNDGNDRVRGNNGNDQLFGGNGDDFIMADAGDDFAYGESGADTVFGYTGADLLDGGDGDDQIIGEFGTNELIGGLGNDTIIGGTGDELIYGGAGIDWLNGGDGNDRIFGGSGVDRLMGGDGDDALHGGDSASADLLFGNNGFDRFLRQAADVVSDRGDGDAVIEFENFSDQWEDLEIEVIDRGFQQLYDSTQNNALLVDTLSTDDLRFLKYDSLGNYAGINYLQTSTSWYWQNGQLITEYSYAREIRIADWDETSSWYNDQYQMVALHEIGHNWDSELELTTVAAELGTVWNSFLAASSWTETNPNDSSYSLSNDGQWWYANSASFAENYGQTNPREDAATMFEYRFSTDPANYDIALQPKLDVFQDVIDYLAGLSS